MDINSFVTRYNVKFFEKSHYYHANCPFCEHRGKTPDTKKKLYLYKNTNLLICFRCGYKDVLEPFDYYVDSDNVEDYGSSFRSFVVDEEDFLSRFSSNLSEKAISYLSKRKILPHISSFYEIREDISSQAIVFPIRDENGDLVSYVLRSYADDATWRYKYPFGFKKSHYVYNLFRVKEIDTVVVCEGVISAISAVPVLKQSIAVPVATFGKQMSDAQMFKIYEKGVKKLYLAYEWDDITNVVKTARRLSDFFKVYICRMPVFNVDGFKIFGDPNDVNFNYLDAFDFVSEYECEFYIRYLVNQFV